jgi:hypothetical protein
MIGNFGWRGVLLNAVGDNNKFQQNNNSGGGGVVFFGSVNTVNYNTGEIVFISSTTKQTNSAKPLNANIQNYPISGEIVMLVNLPKVDATSNTPQNPKSDDNFIRYFSGINIWENPSLNALVSSKQLEITSQPDYFSPTKIQNINPLTSSPGDFIIEGRFGNSIRLGNTNRNFSNGYSTNGETGDPITIINNGQSFNGYTVNETIESDLSSIYLTSTQKISNFRVANNSFSTFSSDKKPYADQYVSPQIILNSSRVILNAKSDSVIISGEKAISLSSNESINFECKDGKIYMRGTDIRLGSKNAKEPVLLGDKTVDQLIKMAEAIKSLSKVISTLKIYPGGNPSPDPSNGIGHELIRTMEKTIKDLEDKTHGIRSNFVKTT